MAITKTYTTALNNLPTAKATKAAGRSKAKINTTNYDDADSQTDTVDNINGATATATTTEQHVFINTLKLF